MLTANVEAKFRKLITVNFNNRNWNWLLNPGRPLVLPIILRVPTSGKDELTPKLEESVQEGAILTLRQSLPVGELTSR